MVDQSYQRIFRLNDLLAADFEDETELAKYLNQNFEVNLKQSDVKIKPNMTNPKKIHVTLAFHSKEDYEIAQNEMVDFFIGNQRVRGEAYKPPS